MDATVLNCLKKSSYYHVPLTDKFRDIQCPWCTASWTPRLLPKVTTILVTKHSWLTLLVTIFIGICTANRSQRTSVKFLNMVSLCTMLNKIMKNILLQKLQLEDVGEKSERLSGDCNQLLKTGKKNLDFTTFLK